MNTWRAYLAKGILDCSAQDLYCLEHRGLGCWGLLKQPELN